jgi:two-component system sensor histidine kinase QseC
MIKSIRYFLLISLLLSITIAAAINGVGNYILDEKVIQQYLDEQLTRMASLIDILYESSSEDKKVRTEIADFLRASSPNSKKKFFFQVFNPQGHLLLASDKKTQVSLQNAPDGFSDRTIDKNDWRIYSYMNHNASAKIIVAERYNLRHELADQIAKSNADILLITYPVFGILVWLIVNFTLRSVTRVTGEIANRASTYLEPVPIEEIPLELKPLVAELNELLSRLKLAFERNKRFSADAAHELRTPLAALKTHAQVALNASTDAERMHALHHVIDSVDRSSHVVAQLLTLGRLGEEESLADVAPLHLHQLATDTLTYLAPEALEKQIDIELAPAPADDLILGNKTSINILIRNLVDNAIRYTPPHGQVTVSVTETRSHVVFRVIDTGPGIPDELRERVFERFFRVLGTHASGSGLGLPIVSQIAKLHRADIQLNTPPTGNGLQFDVLFPKYHASR